MRAEDQRPPPPRAAAAHPAGEPAGGPGPGPAPSPAVVASTPGKLILAGEHAVVYGRPALVAAVGLRLTAAFAEPPAGCDGVRLEVPPLGLSTTLSWREIHDATRRARRAWGAYADAPSPEAFARVRGDRPAHLVEIALGETAEALGETAGRPLALSIAAEIPVGAGFGSSAAAAVAVVAGYAAFAGRPLPPGEVERLALEVERRQHGLPSGVDGATVLHGGLVWAERGAGGRLETRPFAARSPLVGRLAVLHTGVPPETTGAVVAAVRRRLEAEPALEAELDRIETATRALAAELERSSGEGDEDPEAVRGALAACHRALVALGVVPAPVAELVARIEAEGGAAKISGAGSLAGPGAGSLVGYPPEPARIDGWDFLAPHRRLRVALGAPGLRLDTGSER
jgi:mevalonate kinase